MAALTFTDGVGAAVLRNNFPAPADRFANWTPMTRPVGDSVTRMSDGAIVFFKTRQDYGASFDLVGIPVTALSDGVNRVAIADRLVAWLLEGGTVSVACEDTGAHVYATCGLAPGSSPTLRMTNPKTLEFTLSLSLINRAGSPVRMDCTYR